MSDPLITPDDLGIYLNDPGINEARALYVIERATTLCESVVLPLPAGAAVVVERVAGRAYTSITSARQIAQANAANPGMPAPQNNGVYLSRYDRADLRRLTTTGGTAFSINMLPVTYARNLPPWDVATYDTTQSST